MAAHLVNAIARAIANTSADVAKRLNLGTSESAELPRALSGRVLAWALLVCLETMILAASGSRGSSDAHPIRRPRRPSIIAPAVSWQARARSSPRNGAANSPPATTLHIPNFVPRQIAMRTLMVRTSAGWAYATKHRPRKAPYL